MVLSGYKFFLVLILLGTTACSTLPPAAQEYDSFAAYAESVFRHQNKLISRLMMMNGSVALDDNEAFEAALENAEQSMNDACRLLNEYAENEMEGESMSLFFKHRVKASIESCDLKIQELEAMLAELDK